MSNHRHEGSGQTGPEWATPQWIWEPLAESLGGFDLDPASGAESEPIADTRYTIEDDGLEQDWFGDVWLNPPYGRKHNTAWAEKVKEQSQNPDVDTMTCLVSAAPATQWWHKNYAEGDLFTFIEGRVQFEGDADNPASFPSVIVTFAVSDTLPKQYIETLEDMGQVLRAHA